ncbi:hypothetical protein B0H10DRAFT_1955646 [Mycena sp. CBHHK59/15]|nr:hypothetical protein B0H10DRAFT_1955646 [Mycena sp. CBHHK59/15]
MASRDAAAAENGLSESAAENTSMDADPIVVPAAYAAPGPLPPIQDDEDDFGFEIPMVPEPGPIPELYPSDDEDLDYIDGSELPDSGSGVDSDSEVPPAASPPGVDAFVADAGSSSSTVVAAPADWDRPLVPGQSTRAGRKHRVYDTQYGCDLCGKVVTEAERADSELAVHCSMAGCETEWYHRGCFVGEQFTKTWKCPSCLPAKRHRNPYLLAETKKNEQNGCFVILCENRLDRPASGVGNSFPIWKEGGGEGSTWPRKKSFVGVMTRGHRNMVLYFIVPGLGWFNTLNTGAAGPKNAGI